MSTADELTVFQEDQLRHDELVHKDILCLPIQTRIKHMVLHFSKYVGHFAEARETLNKELLTATIVDSWIIVLACANMLNLRLSEKLQYEKGKYEDLHSLGQVLISSSFILSSSSYDLALFGLAKVTGRMAKACESLDHMEKFDSRGTLEDSVIDIARLLLAISAQLEIDLPALVSHRWEEVERKSIFYQQDRQIYSR